MKTKHAYKSHFLLLWFLLPSFNSAWAEGQEAHGADRFRDNLHRALSQANHLLETRSEESLHQMGMPQRTQELYRRYRQRYIDSLRAIKDEDIDISEVPLFNPAGDRVEVLSHSDTNSIEFDRLLCFNYGVEHLTETFIHEAGHLARLGEEYENELWEIARYLNRNVPEVLASDCSIETSFNGNAVDSTGVVETLTPEEERAFKNAISGRILTLLQYALSAFSRDFSSLVSTVRQAEQSEDYTLCTEPGWFASKTKVKQACERAIQKIEDFPKEERKQIVNANWDGLSQGAMLFNEFGTWANSFPNISMREFAHRYYSHVFTVLKDHFTKLDKTFMDINVAFYEGCAGPENEIWPDSKILQCLVRKNLDIFETRYPEALHAARNKTRREFELLSLTLEVPGFHFQGFQNPEGNALPQLEEFKTALIQSIHENTQFDISSIENTVENFLNYFIDLKNGNLLTANKNPLEVKDQSIKKMILDSRSTAGRILNTQRVDGKQPIINEQNGFYDDVGQKKIALKYSIAAQKRNNHGWDFLRRLGLLSRVQNFFEIQFLQYMAQTQSLFSHAFDTCEIQWEPFRRTNRNIYADNEEDARHWPEHVSSYMGCLETGLSEAIKFQKVYTDQFHQEALTVIREIQSYVE